MAGSSEMQEAAKAGTYWLVLVLVASQRNTAVLCPLIASILIRYFAVADSSCHVGENAKNQSEELHVTLEELKTACFLHCELPAYSLLIACITA